MLRDKISSESGATLVLALVFFLLCAVAGSVILIAGSGAAGRLADLKTDQQAYYSTTSAARLMKAEIGKQKYTVSGNNVQLDTSEGHSAGALQGLVTKGLGAAKGGSRYLAEDCSLECDSQRKLNVKFDFDMDTSYGISIIIKKQDSDNKIRYQCTLDARATTKTNADGSTSVQWDSITISK